MDGLGRLVPSARSLLIFEAAARAGSCSAAAREFNLTQPSVSRNIAQLEAHLGVQLFTRSPSGLALTAEGQMLHRAVADGFRQIEAAIQDVLALRTRKEVVELSLSTAFVTHWFIPRLPDFQAAFPSVDLRFQLIGGTLRGAPGNVDLAMRMASPDEADRLSWPFAPELIIPVCSPAYLAARGALDSPARGRRHVLLHLSDTQYDEAMLWGGRLIREPGTTRIAFSDYGVVLQAALKGEGVALGWITVVSRALIDQALIPASARRVHTGRFFHLVAPKGRSLRPLVLAIRDWMIGQMRDDMERLGSLLAVAEPAGGA
ncbi:MAG: LysR family transcriptional regulator [Acidisphaera sp.]|nr:LysR family transcriptional regulator [Acidisphaera sp.]